MRIIEEFLAKTAELPLWSKTPCADFREAMDVVAKVTCPSQCMVKRRDLVISDVGKE